VMIEFLIYFVQNSVSELRSFFILLWAVCYRILHRQ
jgi:hypothetical protein